MALYKLARFEVRPETRDDAERAMHEHATYVRQQVAGSVCTTYRDPDAPHRYVSMTRSDDRAADERHQKALGTRAFMSALSPLLVGAIEITECELVTSSDLAPRRSPEAAAGRGRRSGSTRR